MRVPAVTIFWARKPRVRANGATASRAYSTNRGSIHRSWAPARARSPKRCLRLTLILLRRQDRLVACELEPNAAAALKRALRGEPRAKALTIDGWMALYANIPPKEC